jgi:FlaA1/EpsC-like NDP-sugar epimerase
MNTLELIGRSTPLFDEEISTHENELCEIIQNSSFLVLGGAGSIGQAVTKEIFKRNPRKLDVVDINENNSVELVRDIRSSFGYISGEFRTFALGIGSAEYDAFIEADGEYDYVLNLSALKHVRSEKDPFTLMRMIDVNVFNTIKSIEHTKEKGGKKFFCVSTDKAANPVNMMGGSKRIMEMFLMQHSAEVDISTARFANVAFSDGSLLYGFNRRIEKQQPIVAPDDVRRYFVTPQESGELCLLSCLLGENRDIFFPKLSEALNLISFADIAKKYIRGRGFEPVLCDSEEEARFLARSLPSEGKWPCFFSKSDTTGEKDFEEFFMDHEALDMSRFGGVGIVKNSANFDPDKLSIFTRRIFEMKAAKAWSKSELVDMFRDLIPGFSYEDKGKYLDSKM